MDRAALVAATVVAFAQDAIYGLIYLSYMNHYLLGRLHASGGAPGYTLALYGGTKLISHPVAGRILDRTSPRRLLRIAVALQLLAAVILVSLHSLWAFLGATVLLAVGSAAIWPLVYDMVARTQAAEVRSRVTGILSMAGYVATGTGFGAGVILARAIHWRLPFLILAGFVAAPLALQHLPAFDGSRRGSRAAAPTASVSLRERLGRVALFGLVVFADYAAISSLAAAYGPFTRISLGISLFRTALLLAPAGFAALGALWLSARFSRPGRRLLEMATLYVLAASGAFALAVAPGPWFAMAFAPLLAAGAGGIGPIVAATMIEQGGPDDRGVVVGTLMSIEGAGSVIGPALTAVVIDLASPRAGIGFIGMVFAALVPLSLLAHRAGGRRGERRA